VSSTTTYKRPSTPRTNLIAAHDNVGSDRSQLANQGGYFNGEKIKTIVHHDDSRSQRIFLVVEGSVAGNSRSEARARDADHTL
jgi:hypothetical protein